MIKSSFNFLKNAEYTKNIFLGVLVVIPVCAFLMHILSLCIYGVDIPYMDDWVSLIEGNAGSLSPEYLFKGANDTMSVTGQLLDSLSFRLIGGHNVLNQAISSTVILGGLFILQVLLLKSFTDNKLILGLSVLSIVFMLQPGSYWGLVTLAYHQAVPLLCILGILYIIVKQPSKNHGLSVFFTSLYGGFSYISGAVALFTIALWILVLSFFAPKPINRSYRYSGLGILFGALITLPLQLRVILVLQSGNTHRSDSPWALPSDADFWLYMMGKIARAIGYFDSGNDLLGISLAILVFLFSLLCMLYVTYAVLISKERNEKIDWGICCVYGSLFLTVTLYLFMVSAGRANLREESVSSVFEIFYFGQTRFHFFWVTILLPWLFLLCGKFISSTVRPKKSNFLICSLTVLVIIYIVNYGVVFSHFEYFKHVNRVKTKGLLCLKEQLYKNGKIYCPDLITKDITKAMERATALNLSFISQLDVKSTKPVLLYRYSKTNDKIKTVNAKLNTNTSNLDTIDISAQQDSRIFIKFSDPWIESELRNCSRLSVNLAIESTRSEHMQIFYKLGMEKSFGEMDSVRKTYPVSNTEPTQLEIELFSLSGFMPELRIDPGDTAGSYKLSGLEISCTMY